MKPIFTTYNSVQLRSLLYPFVDHSSFPSLYFFTILRLKHTGSYGGCITQFCVSKKSSSLSHFFYILHNDYISTFLYGRPHVHDIFHSQDKVTFCMVPSFYSKNNSLDTVSRHETAFLVFCATFYSHTKNRMTFFELSPKL